MNVATSDTKQSKVVLLTGSAGASSCPPQRDPRASLEPLGQRGLQAPCLCPFWVDERRL
jgi:hypothetical protein